MTQTVAMRRRRITPRQILLSLRSDPERVGHARAIEFGKLAAEEGESGDAIMVAVDHPRFAGFFNLMFAVWAARTQQSRLRAVGDGQLLETLIELMGEFIANGGLETIVQFITAIVGIFGASTALESTDLPTIPN